MPDKGTEQATPLRKKKARERGDSVRSRELLSAFAMLSGVVTLGVVSQQLSKGFNKIYAESLHMALANMSGANADSTQQLWTTAVRRLLLPGILPAGIVMLASFGAALIIGLVQGGGISFHPNALGLKFDRLNPVTNLGNLFSLRSTARVTKSLVPAAVMLLLGWIALKTLILSMPVMSLVRLPQMFATSYRLTLDAAWVTLAWSGLDYAIEWRSWNQRLKMSKQEIRDEMRDAMGNPQIKAKVRQIQRAMRKRKVKADISRASVVITNPTHYAVALEFSFETMSAPKVLAKGRDLLAAEIREEARWAGVPIVENPPLARSLYKLVEPGMSIPFELYAAVAGILAYLYRQKVEERVRKDRHAKEKADEAVRNRMLAGNSLGLMGMEGFGGGM